MPDTICEPSMLLKQLVRCISQQASSVLLGHPHSNQDQWGVHSPLVTEPRVFGWQVLILTTSWMSRVLQSVSSSTLYAFALLHLQSRWHAWNALQRNTVPLHLAILSLNYLVNVQAHLKIASSSGNTSYWVNKISALLSLEVWIQFLLSSQFASPHHFSSCTDEAHLECENSMNSIRVGHCFMVSLWMSRYHMTQNAYSMSLPPSQYCCSDAHWWDLYILDPTSSQAWNLSDRSTRQRNSWLSLPLRALWHPGAVQ